MATHKVSVAAGLAGYLLLIVEMSGLGVLLRPLLAPTTALVLLWYGLYFGILGRDAAEVASDRMVRTWLVPPVVSGGRHTPKCILQLLCDGSKSCIMERTSS